MTRSQYKRSFHKIFEAELITATVSLRPAMGHHARMRIWFLWVRFELVLVVYCWLTHTYLHAGVDRPADRPCARLAERGLHLLSRKPPSLSLPQTVTQ